MTTRGGARPTGTGPGRLLVAVYGVLAIAATARGAYQVGTRLAEAPLAYLLSLLAGIVYAVATLALARDLRRAAWPAVAFELVGVLVVGTLSVVDVGDFPDETVWSRFGAGYGCVPLVLPFVGLWWLRRTSRTDVDTPASPTSPAVG
ncbi:conserved hypothetical protein [Cellulomonas flavigena DSM 20109]|uniref:Integral membrane protein n=1 Tax=Cellulomonas flavigena (strain ATCC 482 / DSM 20109 / BCRC 11376 / JCM 18109 / NBRC 3775 / NCIMB 8073 / NRS 134) TaxID=446466 RepID=D5UFW8_CELFN|nr:hypothetical protein [Cellulomonas flavigena]ADG74991.1 conserved hypothetical protein [Cellulomonas flavigena DSM 20109]